VVDKIDLHPVSSYIIQWIHCMTSDTLAVGALLGRVGSPSIYGTRGNTNSQVGMASI
jgi:hypothetical protein